MADRFPLILNTNINQIQEIASGDQLDLSGNNIANAGIISATSFSGPIVAGAGSSNITAGIITAVTFKGNGDFVDIDVDGHTDLDNVSIAGVSTFAGAIDLNSDIDVDGHTNLDNVSIAGVTTGTTINATTFVGALTGNSTSADTIDVTSDGSAPGTSYPTFVDGNGSGKTLRLDSGLTYVPATNVLTAGTFSGSGASLTGITNTNISNSAAIALSKLATGALPAGITVSGSNITAGSIHDSDVNASAAIAGTKISPNFGSQNITTTGYIEVGTSGSRFANNNLKFNSAGAAYIDQTVTGQDINFRVSNSSTIDTNVLTLKSNGNVDVANGLDVTGDATVSGNLSVGGVLTYEDVTNVDSVGIVTARNGIKVLAGGANVVGVVTATAGMFVPDNQVIHVGNVAGTGDLQIYHDASGGHSYVKDVGTGDLILQTQGGAVSIKYGSDMMIYCQPSNKVELNYANSPKLATSNTGIDVTGQVVADSASFTDDGSSSPTVKIFTDDANPYALNIGNSSYNASSPFGLNFYNNNSGEGYFRHIGNGAYKDYHFSLHDNSNNKICLKFEADDQSVELYAEGNKKLETTGTGVVVTGVCTATSFSGDGSQLTGISVGITTEQVTPSSNVATLNLAKDDHKIVASGTYTIDVSGGTEAGSHTLRIENSGTANVGFSSYFKFPSGGTPSLPTASGAISLVSFSVHKVGSVGIATVLLAGASVNFS